MKYEKMYIYRLKRSKEIDKKGRPVIFLDYFGEQSLVWCGTTTKNNKARDEPLVMEFNNKITYFYKYNIEKIPTKDLGYKWINKSNNEFYKLSEKDEKILVTKFLSFTNQKNPYEKLIFLELKLQNLEKENELKQEKNRIQEIEKVLEKE